MLAIAVCKRFWFSSSAGIHFRASQSSLVHLPRLVVQLRVFDQWRAGFGWPSVRRPLSQGWIRQAEKEKHGNDKQRRVIKG
jgi:hypothetical protein